MVCGCLPHVPSYTWLYLIIYITWMFYSLFLRRRHSSLPWVSDKIQEFDLSLVSVVVNYCKKKLPHSYMTGFIAYVLNCIILLREILMNCDRSKINYSFVLSTVKRQNQFFFNLFLFNIITHKIYFYAFV